MNIWGKNERSWRRKNRRAVSPIIATILLVAITVVLAAVLYILISQYTKGGSAVTIGSALAIGGSTDGATTALNYYNMTVESSGATLTMSSFIFEVRSPTGQIITVGSTVTGTAVTGICVAVTTPQATTGPYYNIGGAAVGGCTAAVVGWNYANAHCGSPAFTSACSSTTLMSTQYTFSVEVSPIGCNLVGYSLVALGQGSFSGTTSGTIT